MKNVRSSMKPRKSTRREALQLAESMKQMAMQGLRSAVVEQQTSERLAKMLIAIAAIHGGTVVIPMDALDKLPEGAKLVESYSKEQQAIVLQCTAPKVEKPLIESAQLPLVDAQGNPL